jgi:nucleotide-binding universal stress UspA family protein
MLTIPENAIASSADDKRSNRGMTGTPKKLLFTVSDDPNMFNGLRFLCRFFENKSRFDLTLLCMASPDSNYCRWRAGNTQPEQPSEGPEMDSNWSHAREEAMRMLQWDGFSPARIQAKSTSGMICRIEDIEDEIGSETHDAVVMGRRGLNRLKDFTSKSLSRRLFERQPEIPMILCRKPDLNRRNVLLCVDGSDSSYNMARFVASMLEGESHLVTLCNIVSDTSDERDKAVTIFNRCEEIMCSEGFSAERLRHMIYPSDYVPRAILDNANWGKFAVVAVGTTANMRKNLLFGSVSSILFNELTDSVLWVHP